MNVCALIPAFNNASTLAEVVQKTCRQINHVVVIDDGSTDKTAQVAEVAGAHVIKVPRNRGKGNALRIGFRYVLENGFDAVVTLDGDLQHDPAEIPKFIDCYAREGAGIVIGNRLRCKGRIPRMRYGPNRVGVILFSWLTGQRIEDSQCGFRLYDRKMIQDIRILNNGFEAEADILLRAGKRGYRIGFVPVKAIYFSKCMYRTCYRPIRDTFRISIIFLMNLFWKTR